MLTPPRYCTPLGQCSGRMGPTDLFRIERQPVPVCRLGWGTAVSEVVWRVRRRHLLTTLLCPERVFISGAILMLDVTRWYALYVRSRHERVVESGLRGKGYVAFSPFYRTKRKRVDRIAEIDVPLFPGYVFCHFDSNKRLPILDHPRHRRSGRAGA